jgi:hypothetical protein
MIHLFKLVRDKAGELESLKDSSSPNDKMFIELVEAELFAQKLNTNIDLNRQWSVKEYKI